MATDKTAALPKKNKRTKRKTTAPVVPLKKTSTKKTAGKTSSDSKASSQSTLSIGDIAWQVAVDNEDLLHMKKAEAVEFSRLLFSEVVRRANEGNKVQVRGVGSFFYRDYKSRSFNDLDGNVAHSPEKRRLRFQGSKTTDIVVS